MLSFKSFSWLGFLKIIPIMIMLVSGVIGIAQQIILLYSPNPNPVWQAKVFWTGVWVAFVLSAIGAWLLEHAKVRELEALFTNQNKPELELIFENESPYFEKEIYYIVPPYTQTVLYYDVVRLGVKNSAGGTLRAKVAIENFTHRNQSYRGITFRKRNNKALSYSDELVLEHDQEDWVDIAARMVLDPHNMNNISLCLSDPSINLHLSGNSRYELTIKAFGGGQVKSMKLCLYTNDQKRLQVQIIED